LAMYMNSVCNSSHT